MKKGAPDASPESRGRVPHDTHEGTVSGRPGRARFMKCGAHPATGGAGGGGGYFGLVATKIVSPVRLPPRDVK